MTTSHYDLTKPGLFLDPHTLFRQMRQEAPVYFSEQLNSWVLTRYDDICAALRDTRLSVIEETKRIEELPVGERGNLDTLRTVFLDWGGRAQVDEHALFISILKRHFTPQRVLEQRPLVQRLMNELLDRAIASGKPDVVHDIAHPLAMSVVCELTGVPTTEMDMLLDASNAISGLLEMGERDQLYRCQQGMVQLAEYLRPIVADHRKQPHQDLIGVLMSPEAAALDYSDDRIISQCIMFLVVGYHTTANLLCNGLQLLFDHPEQRHKLVNGGFELLANAFDEMMRVHGPVASVRRLALVDFELRGQTIRAGDTLLLALAAANRDPDVFERPDVFDVARANANKQVGFTIGTYSCMGQALARLEGQIFFRTLLQRAPDLRPARPTPDWVAFRPFGRELRTLEVLTA